MTADDHGRGGPTRAQVLEYAFIASLIVVTAIGVLGLLSAQIGDILQWIAGEIHSQ